MEESRKTEVVRMDLDRNGAIASPSSTEVPKVYNTTDDVPKIAEAQPKPPQA